MKIHRIYNELNEIEDMSGDKVRIEISAETWDSMKEVISSAKFGLDTKKLAKEIDELINEAEKVRTTEWTK